MILLNSLLPLIPKRHMKTIKALILTTLTVSLAAPSLWAAELKWGGSIRLRAEQASDGVLGVGKDQKGSWITQMSRLQVEGSSKEGLSLFLQIQDSRTWGGEDHAFPPPSVTDTGTDASANGLDMHQAYVKIDDFLAPKGHAQIGRQEIIFDDARLVGNIGWIQNPQTFDAFRWTYQRENFNADVVAAQVIANDTHPTMVNVTSDSTADTNDGAFYALHTSFKIAQGVINPFLYQVQKPLRLKPGGTVSFDHLQTIGAYIKQQFGAFGLIFQGGNQTGQVTAAKKHKANFYSLELKAKLSGLGFSLGQDQYSGDKVKGGGESNTFNALYATNHAYFGFMDKFLFTPSTGINDSYVKLSAPIAGAKLALNYHNFATASGSYDPNQSMGSEADLTLKIPTKTVALQLGYSAYTGKGEVNYGSTGDTTRSSTWGYVQIGAKF